MTDGPQAGSKLDHLLEELHAELADVEGRAEASNDLLKAVLGDIRARLDERGEVEALPEGVLERLAHARDEFEDSHPRVTGVLGRLIDALASLGI